MITDALLQQEDSVKKGKILFVALFITFSFLFNKTLGPFYPFLSNSLVVATIYAIIAFWGFLWILSFRVNARIMLLVLPQVVLIIFSQILFLDMLFEQTFGRVYETFLIISLLIITFVITHIVFLTSNVFAVSSFKKIPLEAVAKTTIYLISALSIFFVTYGLLFLGIPSVFAIILLLIFCFLTDSIHFSIYFSSLYAGIIMEMSFFFIKAKIFKLLRIISVFLRVCEKAF